MQNQKKLSYQLGERILSTGRAIIFQKNYLKKKFHEDDMLLVFVGDILPYLLSINNLIVKSCHSSIINQMSKKKFAEKGDKEKKGNHTVGVKTVPMFRRSRLYSIIWHPHCLLHLVLGQKA